MTTCSVDSALKKMQATRPNALIFSVNSTITTHTLELFYGCIEEQSLQHNQIDLMIIFNEYEGIDWGMLFNNETSAMRQNTFHKLRRYALVGGPLWLETATSFFSPFGKIETEWFPLEDIEKAWNFIGARPVGEWFTPTLESINQVLFPYS